MIYFFNLYFLQKMIPESPKSDNNDLIPANKNYSREKRKPVDDFINTPTEYICYVQFPILSKV